jgi:hypothetical protein
MCFQPTSCRQKKKALDPSAASCGYIGRVHFLSHEIPFLHNEPPYEHIDAIPHVNVFPVALHDANALLPSLWMLIGACCLVSGQPLVFFFIFNFNLLYLIYLLPLGKPLVYSILAV